MPFFREYTVIRGEETLEYEVEVADLDGATEALKADLECTAEALWAAHVLERWNWTPGHCSMPDDDIIWIFQYSEK